MQSTYNNAIPAELVANAIQTQQTAQQVDSQYAPAGGQSTPNDELEVVAYVKGWRNKLREARIDKENLWTECWQLYRGLLDFTDKEDWNAKIVAPKVFNSVEQATSLIKRILLQTEKPFTIEPFDKDNPLDVLRASVTTDAVKYFLDRADWIAEFEQGLKNGFITGLGVWKQWWGLESRLRTNVQPRQSPEGGMRKQMVQEEIIEGRLFMRAVDPYNFYWLPGSKLNKFTGTIEEIEISRWELEQLAYKGVFGEDGVDKVKKLGSAPADEFRRQTQTRFNERRSGERGPNRNTDAVRLTEYYGPIVLPDKGLIEPYGHCIIANDSTYLVPQRTNPLWIRKGPYVAFSPITIPFRTEGIGIIEHVREIVKMLSRLSNMGVDTLFYSLLPMFEVAPEVYENPEDFETGLTPGKIFRRKVSHIGMPGIQQVGFNDISQGAIAMAAQLDRSHQEGSLISEIQQAIPRFRGYQSAEEISTKDQNQQDLFSGIAKHIETQAVVPLVELAMDLMFQFIDTANDPRLATILGLESQVLAGMTQEQLLELVQGDYVVKVEGISGQVDKIRMLENLVQLINILGQNPEAWLPYINQSVLLRRIIEIFRPAIRDVDEIIVDPAQAQATQMAAKNRELDLQLIQMIPQLVDSAIQQRLALAQQAQAVVAQKQQEANVAKQQ